MAEDDKDDNNASEFLFKSTTIPMRKHNENIKKNMRFAMLGCEMDPPCGLNKLTAQAREILHF